MLKEQLAVLEKRLQELESTSRMFIPLLNVASRGLSMTCEGTASFSFDGSDTIGEFPSDHPSIPSIPLSSLSNASSPSSPSIHPSTSDEPIELQGGGGSDNYINRLFHTEPNTAYRDSIKFLSNGVKKYL